MQFYSKDFTSKHFTLYPLGDFHLGSRQCNLDFIKQVVAEIERNSLAYWVGMGDMMENAVIGSKSDVYTQTIPPKEQIELICKILDPIKKKGLFMIAGNHEQRSMRLVGVIPEQIIAYQLGIPYMGFSCLSVFDLVKCKSPHSFVCYFHHNYGGGYTSGGKVNRAESLRKIVPTADAIFSGHFHITSRIPVTWYDTGLKQIQKKIGYDYITGSCLMWNESYAEEKGKPSSSVEFIKVTFVGGTNGHFDGRKQIYEVVSES